MATNKFHTERFSTYHVNFVVDICQGIIHNAVLQQNNSRTSCASHNQNALASVAIRAENKQQEADVISYLLQNSHIHYSTDLTDSVKTRASAFFIAEEATSSKL